LPNQRANAGLDQNNRTFRSSSGRCAHLRRLAESHPQVLIIALPAPDIAQGLQRGDGRINPWQAQRDTVWPIIEGDCDQ
ncbi:hypothetical protein, partial [Mycobacterium paraffinicum]|uniref:hypothetical protein n=1 Tax=Mycobacterium paraffinicum TaxID=53378 RepID=UPI0021F2F63A